MVVKLTSDAALTASDCVKAANSLNAHYLAATSDAMFKKCFITGSTASINRLLLSRAIFDITEKIDYSVGTERGFYSTLPSEPKFLSQRNVKETETILETPAPEQVATASTKLKRKSEEEKSERESRLPKYPKTDCACVVTLDDDQKCMLDIEMQVKNKQPSMHTRMADYGDYLSKVPLSGDKTKFTARKVYAAALCMWNPDENKLGAIGGIERGFFTSAMQSAKRGVVYPTPLGFYFPICYMEIFLGQAVSVASIVEEHLKTLETNHQEYKQGQVDEILRRKKLEKTNELANKFQKSLDFNVANIRQTLSEFCQQNGLEQLRQDQGLSEKNFSTTELKELFSQLEHFELLQLISVGSLFNKEDVESLFSKTVKESYMSLTVNEENMQLDVQQANEIWFKNSYIKLKEEKKESEEAREVAERSFSVVSELENGQIMGKRFNEIVENFKDSTLKKLGERYDIQVLGNGNLNLKKKRMEAAR